MPSGDPFSDGQLAEISRVLSAASRDTGLDFSVYVGASDGDPRRYAERLHAALGERARNAVLLYVGPGERVLEIVTGADSHRRLSDRTCALATLTITSAFAGGDLVGGVLTGVRMLAEGAGRARSHAGDQEERV